MATVSPKQVKPQGSRLSGKPRSIRQAQAQQAVQLRSQGRTWSEVATVFRATYRVNPRVALRQAHGWSQPQAAEQWTVRWPDDPKTFKNFSYWEQWPSQTGHAPSLETLDRLAQLYECRVTDLLDDCDDYSGQPVRPAAPLWVRDRGRVPEPRRGHDQESTRWPQSGQESTRRPPSGISLTPELSTPTLQAALETIRRAQVHELSAGGPPADAPDRRLRRRTLLLEASSALAVVAAAPLLEVPSLVIGSKASRMRPDTAIVGYAGEVVAGLRRLGGAVGPRITLQPAIALRSAMAAMARSAPEMVTSQALTSYGDLTQLVGWLMFNLGDYQAARYYYDDARAAAYRADDYDLVAYSLAASSHLAIATGHSRQAVDHAQAAQQAARASGSPYAGAYAADVTARAYALAGQTARCQAALDREQTALGEIGDQTPRAPWWYFYDRSFYWGTESECALRLGMPVDASDAAGRSLGQLGPLNLHATALTLAFRAEALIRQGEIAEACETLADSARLTTLNSSRRILRRIEVLREQLSGVDKTAAVCDLDEKLAEYRRARAAAEPAESAMR
jgi:transcriptional regulator with XRE-family HTH domain